MKPETIRRLQENIPELRELLAFLRAEIAKSDTLDGLELLDFKERAYEASVRLRTRDRLVAMFTPLIDPVEAITSLNPKEYAIDVP